MYKNTIKTTVLALFTFLLLTQCNENYYEKGDWEDEQPLHSDTSEV